MSDMYNMNSNGRPLQRTTSRRELLLNSAVEGNWQQTIELLRHMPDSVIGNQGEMLLHEAVKQSQLPIIDMLIERGVDPLATDKDGCSILHLASRSGHEHIVQHLLNTVPSIRDNVNHVSRNGMTAYDMAAESEHVKLLLEENGAAVNTQWSSKHLRKTHNNSSGKSGNGYRDWPELIINAQYHLEDSCEEIKQQVRQVSHIMQETFKEMHGMMRELVDIQIASSTKSNEKLHTLQKQLKKVETEVKKKTDNLNDGVTKLVRSTNDLGTSFKQASEFNDFVYFRIFNKISQKVGLQKENWKSLCKALLESYPDLLVDRIQKDVENHHTKEEDMAYECLTKWHVYNNNQPNKIDHLKEALSKSKAQDLICDIDAVLKDYKKDIPKKGADAISDFVLMELSRNIGREWQQLGVSLGYNRSQLENLDDDYNNNSANRNFAMLSKWRDRQEITKSTIVARLVEALKTIERNDLISKISDVNNNR